MGLYHRRTAQSTRLMESDEHLRFTYPPGVGLRYSPASIFIFGTQMVPFMDYMTERNRARLGQLIQSWAVRLADNLCNG